jgi:hypothetical protein
MIIIIYSKPVKNNKLTKHKLPSFLETTTNPKFRAKKFVSVYQASPSKKEEYK